MRGRIIVPTTASQSSGAPGAGRVAAIDIGTNSVLLLVAERGPAAALCAVLDEATVTRLGAGVDRSRRLERAAVVRTLDCLQQFARRARQAQAGELRAVATSALRDADNGEAFLDEAAQILGVRPLVVSGHDEARLTSEGALGGLGLGPGEVTVCDLGGGSTELVGNTLCADGAVTVHTLQSFDLGCVRATERHLHGDPPSADELARLRDEARLVLAGWPNARRSSVVAVGGTATSVAALVGNVVPYDHSRIHGFRLARRALAHSIEQLRVLPLGERKRLAALDPRRADVIVAGAVLLDEIAGALGTDELRISDRGLRWGVAARMVSGRPVAG